MKKSKGTIVVNMRMVRNSATFGYVPIQVTAAKYEEGKPVRIYESMINPQEHVKNMVGLPIYASEYVLQMAPMPRDVANQLSKFSKDCDIIADDHFEQFMLENNA